MLLTVKREHQEWHAAMLFASACVRACVCCTDTVSDGDPSVDKWETCRVKGSRASFDCVCSHDYPDIPELYLTLKMKSIPHQGRYYEYHEILIIVGYKAKNDWV